MVEIIELYRRRRKISRETFPVRMSDEFASHENYAFPIKAFNAQEAFAPAMAG